MKILKVCGARKPKKAIFESLRHQILLKVGTLLHFSRCYTVVRQKLKLGFVTWSQISTIHFFTIFIETPWANPYLRLPKSIPSTLFP